MEHLPESAEVSPRRLRAMKVGAVLAGAVLALGLGKQYESNSGELTVYEPTKPSMPRIDSNLNLNTLNLHGEGSDTDTLDDIDEIVSQKSFDGIAFNEITADDAEIIHKQFGEYYLTYVTSDALTNREEGGLGNALMTLQPQMDIETVSIDGLSSIEKAVATTKGVYTDASGLDLVSMSSTKRALAHGKRSAIAATILVRTKGGLQPIRLITGHPSPHDILHAEQFAEYKQFIDRTSGNMSAFVLGDFNSTSEEMDVFRDEGWTVPETEPTLVNTEPYGESDQKPDKVVYRSHAIDSCPTVWVDTRYKTDHYLLRFEADLND